MKFKVRHQKVKSQKKPKPQSSSNSNRQWHMVHVVDQANFPYSSIEDENFKKCWALENLKPVEITGPPQQMKPITKAHQEVNKQLYAGLLEDLKAAKENGADHQSIMMLQVLMDLVKRCLHLAPLIN